MWIKLHTGCIPWAPVPMGRPRFTRKGRAYTPKKTKDYLINASVHIKEEIRYLPPIPAGEPIRIEALFIHKRPKSKNRKKDPSSRIAKTTKPDLDNLWKMLLDSLVYASAICDDNQITSIGNLDGEPHQDCYAAKGEDPQTLYQIFIWR